MIVHLSEAEFAAIRAQVASLAALLDALADGQITDESKSCPHAELENEGTFGAPVWRCQHCGQIVPAQVQDQPA